MLIMYVSTHKYKFKNTVCGMKKTLFTRRTTMLGIMIAFRKTEKSYDKIGRKYMAVGTRDGVEGGNNVITFSKTT